MLKTITDVNAYNELRFYLFGVKGSQEEEDKSSCKFKICENDVIHGIVRHFEKHPEEEEEEEEESLSSPMTAIISCVSVSDGEYNVFVFRFENDSDIARWLISKYVAALFDVS
jgi:hypothetical protein